MIISKIVKSRCTEKKDCKITNNGVIWLKKGEYGNRIAGKILTPRNEPKTPIDRYSKQYLLTKKLTDNDVNYNPKGDRLINQQLYRCKDRKESVRKLYSVNKRKVRARLTNFINTEEGKDRMYFYSISFPKNITYNTAYKLLNSVLTTLRNDHAMKHYLWIAERQKNGTIHFHLATFHYFKARVVNEIVKKYLKYAIRKQELQWTITAANNYNGVDIAKNRVTRIPTNFSEPSKSRKIAGYVTKYITKGSEKFDRQAWNSSRSLAAISDGICCNVNEVVDMFSSWVISDTACFANDFCMFFRWLNDTPKEFTDMMYGINNERIKSVS